MINKKTIMKRKRISSEEAIKIIDLIKEAFGSIENFLYIKYNIKKKEHLYIYKSHFITNPLLTPIDIKLIENLLYQEKILKIQLLEGNEIYKDKKDNDLIKEAFGSIENFIALKCKNYSKIGVRQIRIKLRTEKFQLKKIEYKLIYNILHQKRIFKTLLQDNIDL